MLDALRNISYYCRGTTLKGETAHYRDQAELREFMFQHQGVTEDGKVSVTDVTQRI